MMQLDAIAAATPCPWAKDMWKELADHSSRLQSFVWDELQERSMIYISEEECLRREPACSFSLVVWRLINAKEEAITRGGTEASQSLSLVKGEMANPGAGQLGSPCLTKHLCILWGWGWSAPLQAPSPQEIRKGHDELFPKEHPPFNVILITYTRTYSPQGNEQGLSEIERLARQSGHLAQIPLVLHHHALCGRDQERESPHTHPEARIS